MRESKIQYNPALTVKENAKRNGVSEAAVRYYIKVNFIDRNFERKQNIIEDCRKYLKKHPKATRTELQQKTGHSLSTIRMFWEYISTGKELTNFDGEKAKKRQEKKKDILKNIPVSDIYDFLDNISEIKPSTVRANKKELWSEVLTDIPKMFRIAEEEDVSELREFFFNKSNMPMLFIGSGGANGSFAALLYGMNAGIGIAITPLQFASLSDSAIKNSRIMLLSKGGRNDDIVYAAKRAVSVNPENTACLTFHYSDENRMVKILEGTKAKIFLFHHPEIKDGFTSVRGSVYKYALLYKTFTNRRITSELNISLSPSDCFIYRLNHDDASPVNFRRIEHFIVLNSSYGEPIAIGFESIMAETGICSTQVVDYRNYCHGRFLFASNHTENEKEPRCESNVAIVLLITPREKSLAEQLRKKVIPRKTPIIIIETPYDSPLATIDLLIKTDVLITEICEKGYGVNPYSPQNFSNIDKRIPINGISFIRELEKNGNLTYAEPKAKVADTIIEQQIQTYIEQEHANTESLKANPSFYPVPTKADLYNPEWNQYDATKYMCVAFRGKEDLWKDKWVPFGNMNNGFPFKIGETEYQTSEQAYICGVFSNDTPEHRDLQEKCNNARSGYEAKRMVRLKNREQERKDWREFKIDWMLYCVWQKIQQNQEFRDLLLAVPEGATIIEDNSFKAGDVDKYWGCYNPDRSEFGKLARKYAKSLNLNTKKATQEAEDKLVWDFCNYGVFEGTNEMGRILTYLKDCLHKNIEPEINYELLNTKKIHLSGILLTFEKNMSL